MKTLSGLERILTTIRHQEPDRVPTFDLDIDRGVMHKIKPDISYEDFVEYMDLDGLVLFETREDKYEVLNEHKRIVRNKWGTICRFGAASEFAPVFVEAPIKSENDIENYVPPDPNLSGVYPILEQWVKRFKGKKAIIAHVCDPSFTVRDFLLGQVEYFKAIKTNPDLLERLNEITGEYHLSYIKSCIDIGADIVFMSTDLATNIGPFLSLEDTKRFVMPNNRKITQYAKSKGIPCLRHSDGNIWPLFDMLIDVGFDGIHPIDPVAGMDLGEAKAKYGDKVCLMGNVDCAYIMTWGTTEEVREDVRRCMRQAAKGGGYICMTSNSVHSATKPENYVAMVEAIKEYGRYPIKI